MTDSSKYFTYTTSDGLQHTATNPFYNSDGSIANPNGQPVNSNEMAWDQHSWETLVESEEPSWYSVVSLPFPPIEPWDALEGEHELEPSRPCISCGMVGSQCSCHPESWIETLSAWESDYYLHDCGDGRGVCVYSKYFIPAGTILAHYAGEITFSTESTTAGRSTYNLRVWPSIFPGSACVRAERKGNFTRFLAHSCENNCTFGLERIGHHRIVVVTTIRDVNPNNELTVSYGDGYFCELRCLCGSANCISLSKAASADAKPEETNDENEGKTEL